MMRKIIKSLTDIPNKFQKILVVSIFIFAIFKLLLITTTSPIFGYANNFDFHRQSSCVGLWLDVDKDRHSPRATPIIPNLINDGYINLNGCQLSIDTLIPQFFSLTTPLNGMVEIKNIGLIRVLILLSLTLLLLFRCNLNENQKLIAALFFGLIFCNLTNLLYFNTLYLESAVLIFLYLSGSSIIFYSSIAKINLKLFTFVLLNIYFLGLTKEQYLPLAIIFSLSLLFILLARGKFVLAFLALFIALLIPTTYYSLNDPDKEGVLQSISHTNNVNTYLGAVLPESTNQSKALKILGLPESCANAIGLDWYNPKFWQMDLPCQEVKGVSRTSLLLLFIKQPKTFFVPIFKITQKIYPLKSNLPFLENSTSQTSQRLSLLKFFSYSDWLEMLNEHIFLILILLEMGLFLILLPVVIVLIIKNKYVNLSLSSLFVGSLILNYSLISSVFGDGYTEPLKHSIGFFVGIVIATYGLLSTIYTWTKSKFLIKHANTRP